MNESGNILLDTTFWISILSIVIASVAVLISYLGMRTAKRSLRLSEEQDRRHAPRLVPYLKEGYCKSPIGSSFRVFAFSISVSNPSDTDNSVARLDLELNYTTCNRVCMNVKVPHDSTLASELGYANLTALHIPFRIDAHQTIAGWALFRIDDSLLGDGEIDGHKVVLSDSHGEICSLEPSIVHELADEEETSESKD